MDVQTINEISGRRMDAEFVRDLCGHDLGDDVVAATLRVWEPHRERVESLLHALARDDKPWGILFGFLPPIVRVGDVPMSPGHPVSLPSTVSIGTTIPFFGSDYDDDCLEDRVARRAHEAIGLALSLAGAPDSELDPETPGRWAGALLEMLSGYRTDIPSLLRTFDEAGDPGIVVARDLPFSSLCLHHMLPFWGSASVAYLPSLRIVGLSKIPRLLRAVTRRLQVQERVGQMVADALMSAPVAAAGAMVVVRGHHTCMSCRGVESTGAMVTSCVRGVFRNDPAARAEALTLMEHAR